MSAWKIETLDEVLEVCQRITAQIGGCTCPDEPHQNALHDLAVDLPEWLAAHDAEVGKAPVGIYSEVQAARDAAHAKHGDNGIGSLPGDSPRWLSILVEEVGEVAHELTYDSDGDLRKELIQVAAVATAWADALAASPHAEEGR